jgi:uncharacterized phage protein (TIGR01671 family)
MREVKFRAWDKRNNQMLDVIAITWLDIVNPNNTNLVLCQDKDKNFFEHKMEDTELMQYTGLEDQNGKEIYEDDIVNIKSTVEEVTQIDECVKVVYDYEFLTELGYAEEVEIIGNIYENPELLAPE